MLGSDSSTIVVIIRANERHRPIGSLNRLYTSLLPLIGGTDAWSHIFNVNAAFIADGFDKGLPGDLSSLDIIRANVGQREGHWTACIVAVTNKGIDRNNFDARVIGPHQWRDHSLLIACRDNHKIDLLCDVGINNRRLQGCTELGRSIDEQLHPEFFRHRLRAFLHCNVEGIALDALYQYK